MFSGLAAAAAPWSALYMFDLLCCNIAYCIYVFFLAVAAFKHMKKIIPLPAATGNIKCTQNTNNMIRILLTNFILQLISIKILLIGEGNVPFTADYVQLC